MGKAAVSTIGIVIFAFAAVILLIIFNFTTEALVGIGVVQIEGAGYSSRCTTALRALVGDDYIRESSPAECFVDNPLFNNLTNFYEEIIVRAELESKIDIIQRIPFMLGNAYAFVSPYDLAQITQERTRAAQLIYGNFTQTTLYSNPTTCSIELYAPFRYAQGNLRGGIAEMWIR